LYELINSMAQNISR